jgi:hypothetical protein
MGRWAKELAFARAAKARTISGDFDGTSYFEARASVLGLRFVFLTKARLCAPRRFMGGEIRAF